MKYKLIAIDVDGTLLNEKNEITQKTRNAVKLCKEKDVMVCISSGRPVQGIEYINKSLDLDSAFIAYNGAMVADNKRNIIYEKKLCAESAGKVIELGEKYNTTIVVWLDNILYTNKINERVKDYEKISNVNAKVPNDMFSVIKNGVTKILWSDEVPVINDYLSHVGRFLPEDINFHTSRPYFLEFVDKNASKGIALNKLRIYYGIKQEEIVAIGDGFNDISMLEYAGLGVAMDNAPTAVKEKADYITLSNDEDGVSHVIEKYIIK